MRARIFAALALLLAVAPAAGAVTTKGYTSRPQVQALGVGTAAPATAGNASITGTLSAGAANVTGAVSVGGGLGVTGNLIEAGAATVSGAATFNGATALLGNAANPGTGTSGIWAGMSGTTPDITFVNSAGGTDSKYWQMYANPTVLQFTTVNDAWNSAGVWMTATRSGNAVTSVNFTSGTLENGGVAVCLANATNCPTHQVVSGDGWTTSGGCTYGGDVTGCTKVTTGEVQLDLPATLRVGFNCTVSATDAYPTTAWSSALVPVIISMVDGAPPYSVTVAAENSTPAGVDLHAMAIICE